MNVQARQHVREDARRDLQFHFQDRETLLHIYRQNLIVALEALLFWSFHVAYGG